MSLEKKLQSVSAFLTCFLQLNEDWDNFFGSSTKTNLCQDLTSRRCTRTWIRWRWISLKAFLYKQVLIL